MKNWLRKHGYFVGKRNKRFNRAFCGEFMVCDRSVFSGPSTNDASEGTGAFCIVGNNLNALIRDAYDHLSA